MTAIAQNTDNTFARTENRPANLQRMGGIAGIIAALTFLIRLRPVRDHLRAIDD
jgi:ADP-dependent phosphofructokinase/glucokinase